MERQNIKQTIDTYKQELKRATYHPILKRDIGEANLDKVNIYSLLLPLLNGEKWTEAGNTAAIAVGAVHAAFNAHNEIELSDVISTNQQLQVLSGDYFSGIHYRLLASLPDIHFILALSTTIGRINELKTSFHNEAPSSPKELVETIQLIEAGCIIQFFHTFGYAQYVPLVSAALPLLALEPIVEHSPEQAILATYGWEVDNEDAKRVLTELRLNMEEAIDAADFLMPYIKEDIRGMTTPLLDKMI